MDGKTLEYMGERVDKGRKILSQIKVLEEKKLFLESKEIDSVRFDSGSSATKMPYETGVINELKEAAINILDNEIGLLKLKFEEI
ncbi:hypothetical protein HMPREF1210_01175 [Paenisporosarcina sp. HGH0030]|uniref:hypothetical protein n=1 Tax=Paenisporosarcina sp. HGH0030 TaxID=1078085 RepID=UPI00034E8F40|nr:hypothetical protein [Paenisporosarcina sp. HGH0030]EPD52795.1 hypothetical protein HMPREF1210_01175 [Paenisporosarcina sp. HGH0030]